MKDLRAFFAVEVDDIARCEAASVAEKLRAAPSGDGVRWVRPEAFHVTLRFLGDIARGAVADLVRCVEPEVSTSRAFELTLGPVSGLPSTRRPRVVVMDLEPHEPLTALAGAVERGVVAAGFEGEERTFRPHLTLGRVRGRAPSLADAPRPAYHSFAIREVVLFHRVRRVQRVHRVRSERSAPGATYTPLRRIALA